MRSRLVITKGTIAPLKFANKLTFISLVIGFSTFGPLWVGRARQPGKLRSGVRGLIQQRTQLSVVVGIIFSTETRLPQQQQLRLPLTKLRGKRTALTSHLPAAPLRRPAPVDHTEVRGAWSAEQPAIFLVSHGNAFAAAMAAGTRGLCETHETCAAYPALPGWRRGNIMAGQPLAAEDCGVGW
ncbi:hypothetical protein EJ06DRAFT_284500 [Trichodelitschia bisporula]|uniref:Uncharacterized protein n=1 Tax=Trichodelitschia bisporula TaxID=703511 RepID=A0A6G1I6I6_9PEZI|nr:hypothetical protein EJ06DRAFT_284500 [Trichodelitschia bisporula]